MQTILFFVFLPFCIVGLFYLFHCDWDAMLFSGYGRVWQGFEFDDVKMTAFKILCAIISGIFVAAVLSAFTYLTWPYILGLLALIVPSYGGALLLRKLSKRKKLDGSKRK